MGVRAACQQGLNNAIKGVAGAQRRRAHEAAVITRLLNRGLDVGRLFRNRVHIMNRAGRVFVELFFLHCSSWIVVG